MTPSPEGELYSLAYRLRNKFYKLISTLVLSKKSFLIFSLKVAFIIALYFGAKTFFAKNKIHYVDDFKNLSLDEGKFFHSSLESPSKGNIPFCVYLPPDWKSNDTMTYPLLIFLYGQGGDEFSFSNDIPAQQLNQWIKEKTITPFVLFCFLGNKNPEAIQWFDSDNENFLISDARSELKDFCRKNFRAGMTNQQIALEGQSRGASGVLHYAFKYPNHFSSFISNAFVSDYTLNNLKSLVRENKVDLMNDNFRLRIEIGDKDSFAKNYDRKGSKLIHEYLMDQNIAHEYEMISDCDHWYRDFWNHYREEEKMLNGLFHLKYHEVAWNKN